MLFTLTLGSVLAQPIPFVDGEFARDVEVLLPVPVARPTLRDAAFCYSVSPTLSTSDITVGFDGVEVRCGSGRHATVLCVRIPATTPWPDDIGGVTCPGPFADLRASFVRGHDPYDDPRDGVDVVRVAGPYQLRRDRTVTFFAPGWRDAWAPWTTGPARCGTGASPCCSGSPSTATGRPAASGIAAYASACVLRAGRTDHASGDSSCSRSDR
ncbi:MAG: hypothetical protein AAF211_03810 [Myxococcota bacterium]